MCDSVVELLASICEALLSSPTTKIKMGEGNLFFLFKNRDSTCSLAGLQLTIQIRLALLSAS